jgi:hypothetical protein
MGFNLGNWPWPKLWVRLGSVFCIGPEKLASHILPGFVAASRPDPTCLRFAQLGAGWSRQATPDLQLAP